MFLHVIISVLLLLVPGGQWWHCATSESLACCPVDVSCFLAPQGIFVVAVVLMYLYVFSPTIGKLNTMLRNARATLLLFPEEVVSGLPALRIFMKDFAKVSVPQ